MKNKYFIIFIVVVSIVVLSYIIYDKNKVKEVKPSTNNNTGNGFYDNNGDVLGYGNIPLYQIT